MVSQHRVRQDLGPGQAVRDSAEYQRAPRRRGDVVFPFWATTPQNLAYAEKMAKIGRRKCSGTQRKIWQSVQCTTKLPALPLEARMACGKLSSGPKAATKMRRSSEAVIRITREMFISSLKIQHKATTFDVAMMNKIDESTRTGGRADIQRLLLERVCRGTNMALLQAREPREERLGRSESSKEDCCHWQEDCCHWRQPILSLSPLPGN